VQSTGAFIPVDFAGIDVEFPTADEGDAADLGVQRFGAAEAFFEFFAGGDVGMRADHPERATVGAAAHNFAAVEDPLPSAGFGPHAVLVLVKQRASVVVGVRGGFATGEILGMDEPLPAGVVVGDIGGFVAQHAGPPFVVIEVAAGHIPIPHAVVRAFEGELPALFGEFEILAQFFLGGDVAIEADEPQRAALGVAMDMRVRLDVADGTVGANEAKLRVVGGDFAGDDTTEVIFGGGAVVRMEAGGPAAAGAVKIGAGQIVEFEHPIIPGEAVVGEVEFPDAVVG
jgi:hypothetical protein